MLYIVSTPIGNLQDLTFRAKEILEFADVIVCEDTRVTSKLLAAYGIKKPLKSLHQHSTDVQIDAIINEMKDGGQVAYVSDAGTPGVNDPGGKLVAVAYKAGVSVVTVPGPSALTAAISLCGFPMEKFTYLGFAPHKKGRKTFFENIMKHEESVIFFESTHRLIKALESLAGILTSDVSSSERMICVCREMTKMHETVYRGSAGDVLEAVKATSVKGESVIIVAPSKYHE